MRLLIATALFIAFAAAGHWAALDMAPKKIMEKAMTGLQGAAGGPNQWSHGARTSSESRRVVRPSPDLAYSVCVYDLTDGPVRIGVQPWEDYVSLSLYAANTDNFFVINDRDMGPDGYQAVLTMADQTAPKTELPVLISPSLRGVVLTRRLAPDAFSFERADEARRDDICAPL